LDRTCAHFALLTHVGAFAWCIAAAIRSREEKTLERQVQEMEKSQETRAQRDIDK